MLALPTRIVPAAEPAFASEDGSSNPTARPSQVASVGDVERGAPAEATTGVEQDVSRFRPKFGESECAVCVSAARGPNLPLP